MTAPASTAAIARATGVPWSEWAARLDAAGGGALDHRGLVAAARRDLGHIDNPDWWAQGVAVAYEQHIGRRAPGQRQDGTFEATASRTHGGTLDEGAAAWRTLMAGRDRIGDAVFAGAPTETTTPAYRRWRVTCDDGTRLLTQVSLRGDRAVIAATWSGLPDAGEKDSRRALLRELLAGLDVSA